MGGWEGKAKDGFHSLGLGHTQEIRESKKKKKTTTGSEGRMTGLQHSESEVPMGPRGRER